MIRVYAEFVDEAAIAAGIRALRGKAVDVEAYLPYWVPAVEEALTHPPSKLSIAVFAGGIGGAAGAYGLQWLLNAYLYPLDVGGRPPHFPLAFVPITFEMGVLFASFTAVAAVFIGARLLRLWDPSRDIDGIESATGTGFWLDARVKDEDVADVVAALRENGATAIREVRT